MTAAVSPEQFAQAAKLATAMRAEIGKALVGQKEVVDAVLAAFLAGGHVLIEGVPGLGKTLLVRALARTFAGSFGRIQFTPDLMPADVTGHTLYDPKNQAFTTRRGPVFVNLLLADEINRAPAKTQAALLEVMQEGQVTIEGKAHPLEPPFMVLATQNPIEQEGTYALPEAQLDRFLLKVVVNYPERNDEKEILLRMSTGQPIPVQPRLTPATIIAARREVAEVQLDQRLVDYIVDLVRATREPGPLVAYGASPRASIALAQASRAIAYLRGRRFVIPEDVQAVAADVMRHRIVLTFEAEAEDVTADVIVQKVLAAVRAP